MSECILTRGTQNTKIERLISTHYHGQSFTWTLNRKVQSLHFWMYIYSSTSYIYITYDDVEHMFFNYNGSGPGFNTAYEGIYYGNNGGYDNRCVDFFNNGELKDKVIQSIRFASAGNGTCTNIIAYCQ